MSRVYWVPEDSKIRKPTLLHTFRCFPVLVLLSKHPDFSFQKGQLNTCRLVSSPFRRRRRRRRRTQGDGRKRQDNMEVSIFPYQEARRGETSTLRAWLIRGGQINAPLLRSVAETWTPLTLACAEGDVALVRLIVETGGARASASVGTKVLASWAPLHVAARYGHAAVAATLLELGATVDVRDTIGLTPLMHAAGNGHLRTMEVLLEAGTNASSESPGGATAVDLAELAGFDDAVALLQSRALAEDARGGVARREAIGSWLRSLGCGEYLGRFLRAGYDDLSFMASHGITEADLDCVGVPREKLGLRKKLLAMHGVGTLLDASGDGRSSGTEELSMAETGSESEREDSDSSSGSGSSSAEDESEAETEEEESESSGSDGGNSSDSETDT